MRLLRMKNTRCYRLGTGRAMSFWLAVWLLLCFGANAQNSSSPLLEVDGAVFTAPCYENLVSADVNGDGALDGDEYVLFAQLQSPGTIDNISSFMDLPTAYISAFTTVACYCNKEVYGGDPTATNCCIDNPQIRITSAPGSSQSAADFLYLYQTCGLTDAAGRVPSPPPTPQPVAPPTPRPVVPPTPRPVVPPTPQPVVPPTPQPVVPPTKSPTSAPTPLPSATPSVPATNTPVAATAVPSTTEPTSSPVTAASSSPTATATPSPTNAPETTSSAPSVPKIPIFELTARTNYTIGVANGQNISATDNAAESYLSDLIVAMDRLAPTVAVEVFDQRRKLANIRVRRLSLVTVQLPTSIENDKVVDCQIKFENVTADGDVCQEITANVVLLWTHAQDDVLAVGETWPTRMANDVDLYEAALYNAIFNGRLENYLMDVNPDSPATVLTSLSPVAPAPATSPESTEKNLTSGAISGIVVGVLAIALIPIALFLFSRRQTEKRKAKEAYDYAPYEHEENAHDMSSLPQDSETDIYTDAEAVGVGGAALAGGGLAANYGTAAALSRDENDDEYVKSSASRKALEAMEAGDDLVAEPEMDVHPDSSSNAGSSGWSSSAGISSLNTGSVDDSMDAAAAAGSTLAAIGATSALSRKINKDNADKEVAAMKSNDSESVPSLPTVSRAQLDSLIEAGDWAAVGATAALLAAASDSQSASSRSRTSDGHLSSSRGISEQNSSVDAARAAELDHLVDAGDWEGVVLAAAKFEASSVGASAETGGSTANTGDDKTAGSKSGESYSQSDSATGTGTGTAGSPSVSTSVSESPSKAQKRAEVRSEVEALVRRVVPEEIDNVDEMMNQFKGREEELVETLRTMQERAVAQKARTAGHKAAKVQARQSVQRDRRGVPPPAGGAVASQAALFESGVAFQAPSDGLSAGAAAGIGLAAGAAAGAGVMAMGRASKSTGSDSGPDTVGSGAASGGSSADPAQTRTALEMAIESGDWEAVGQAAALMNDAGSMSSNSTGDHDMSSAGTGSTRSRRNMDGLTAQRAAELDAMIDKGDWSGVVAAADKFTEKDKPSTARSEEEEDALAQAEAWMKIAEQKKAQGAGDAGASDAAEWAISRSLSQLKQAEKREDVGDEDEV